MAESKMKEVAKLLGVEWGVPFRIKIYNGRYLTYNPYVFKNNGLYDRDNDCAYWVLWELLKGECEIEKPILTEKEKKYLEGVIEPFREKISYILKRQCNDEYYIEICYVEYDVETNMPFPFFKKDTMYKGMELDKEYTLEELGLFQD